MDSDIKSIDISISFGITGTYIIQGDFERFQPSFP